MATPCTYELIPCLVTIYGLRLSTLPLSSFQFLCIFHPPYLGSPRKHGTPSPGFGGGRTFGSTCGFPLFLSGVPSLVSTSFPTSSDSPVSLCLRPLELLISSPCCFILICARQLLGPSAVLSGAFLEYRIRFNRMMDGHVWIIYLPYAPWFSVCASKKHHSQGTHAHPSSAGKVHTHLNWMYACRCLYDHTLIVAIPRADTSIPFFLTSVHTFIQYRSSFGHSHSRGLFQDPGASWRLSSHTAPA